MMTSHNDAAGARPSDETRPNWVWLQDRVGSTQVLDEWLGVQLAELEKRFDNCVTANSRRRHLRNQFIPHRDR